MSAPQSSTPPTGTEPVAAETAADAVPETAFSSGQAVATGPNGTAVPFQNASLYVGDLHPDVTEALLYDIFNAVGPVSSMRVCRDAVTRRSLGYAYVNFHNASDAERALDTMNYTLIKDRPCRIMWSQRDPSLRRNGAGNVFVKHLDLSIDNKALFDTFSLFGNILSCKVVTDAKGKSRGYGFVHFETVEAADEAIKKINGMLLAGKEVFVGKFLKRNERPGVKAWTNVYVKNLPLTWGQKEFEELFGECGPVASSIIMTGEDGASKGFGFVDFEDNESAVAAIEKFNGYDAIKKEMAPVVAKAAVEAEKENEADNKETEGSKEKPTDTEGEPKPEKEEEVSTTLVVCRAQKKTDRERELTQKFEQMKVERQSQYQGVNLYVKNLDEAVDDEALKKAFDKFGNITSALIMREKSSGAAPGEKVQGASKGFGFVCFSSPEEAIRAVTEMNGTMLNGKPLYVALAQRREQRRAQLEAQHRQQQRMLNVPGVGMGHQPGMYPYNPATQNMAGGLGQMGMPNQMPPQMQGQMAGGQFRGMGPMRGGARGMPQQMQQMQQQPRMQFNANARNTGMAGMPGAGKGMRHPGGMQMHQNMGGALGMGIGGEVPLNPELLASANQAQRKTMIGEKLYPMVEKLDHKNAAKITGMLLEMENNELLHLLESPDALILKVTEAHEVLKNHAR